MTNELLKLQGLPCLMSCLIPGTRGIGESKRYLEEQRPCKVI